MKKTSLLLTLSFASITTAALAITASPDKTPWQTYENSTYHFKLNYPAGLISKAKFTGSYHIPSTGWHYPVPDAARVETGQQVVEFPVYTIKNTPHYPDYYSALVRVGVSTEPTAVKNCLVGSAKTAAMNGITFTVFPIDEAGMSQYAQGASYRTVHDNTCYAIEAIAVGAVRMEKADPNDISDNVLKGYYQHAEAMVKTFNFTD